MFHLDNGSGIDVMPPQKQTISRQPKWFTVGDTQTPPSYPGADWFNIVQAELLNVLKDGGITPSKSELNQLSAAIRSIINKNQIKINDASLITRGIVKLSSATDSNSETDAATALAVKIVNEKTDNAHYRISQVHDFSIDVNNRVNAISDTFLCEKTESRVRSPGRQFHISIRNDGAVAMYSYMKNDFSWSINRDGWFDGFVDVARIGRLEPFVKDRVLPVGIPQPWPSEHLPAGWLECNGSPFDVNQFPKLAAAYPSGTLPDLRGVFIRGKDNGRGLDPNRGILSFQDDAIRNIVGEAMFSEMSYPVVTSGAFHVSSNPSTPNSYRVKGGGSNPVVRFDASRVTPVSHDNHPRNIAFIYIVKAE